MAKIPKQLGELVEDAIKGAKVARTVAKDAKPLRGVLSPVTAKPSRIIIKPPVYRGKPYVAPRPLVRGQSNEHQYSDRKTAYRPEEISVEREIINQNALNRPFIRPEDLQGGYLYGLLGDRSMAGTTIKSINGIPLRNPVYTEGGGNFMFNYLNEPESIWASSDSVISRQNREMRELAEQGKDVYGSYMTMGGKGVDFNKEMSDLFSYSLGDITKTDQKRINSMVENYRFQKELKDGSIKTVYPYKDFVGIESQDLDKWLRGLTGKERSDFIALMGKTKGGAHGIRGIPDVGILRIADTAPDLLDVPMYSSGYAIGKYNPNIGIVDNPINPHSTYTSQIAGTPVGTFGVNLPYEMVYRDWARKLADVQAQKSMTPYYYATNAGVTPVQYMDQEMVDILSKAIEDFNKLIGEK
jgi:hypothetical protein